MKTVCTFNNPECPAEICRLNGWTVGTKLVGNEGYDGDSVIEITAVGEEKILAKWTTKKGRTYEESTTLACRDWVEVDG